jgi:aryl-phospho-beta-D-glucosidase BglC (GH1 family)
MSIKSTFFFAGVLCLLLSSLSAQGFLHTDAKEIVNEAGEPYILKGMGLGGWMLQEGYMLQTAGFANAQHQLIERMVELVGQEATDEFYAAWRANHTNENDIEAMHQAGFNSVRLPMHYNLYTLPIEDEPVAGEHTWLEEGFALTDSLINWCKARDMYVILDLHAAPGGQGNDQGISDRDEDKPSLWDSEANQDKTVALWGRLAERYKDEPTVGAYDLINEVNYSLPGGTALRNLYGRITTAIRAVDQEHLIFIEGNWFANDFTGLTPPWDNNMAYSPHKYWSVNDQASIQWVIDLREAHNVPIYFGETGENSNVWFQTATKLFDEHNMGWAWWPWKKVDAIAGPVSVERTAGWQLLIDYWEGREPEPSASEATDILLDLTDKLKLENARYQKDVIDALFRQNTSDEAIPYKEHQIPGVIHSPDFDMGKVGSAYFDVDQANYQVTTGNFTAWNNGWVYRNDAVDLEKSMDDTFTDGVHVGWTAAGEWMQYTVDVQEDGLYTARVRTAANADGGAFHFQVGEADITTSRTTPNTGDWQDFQTTVIQNFPLATTDKKLRLFVDKEGFNLGGFEFVRTGDLTSLDTRFLVGQTISDHSVALTLNKPLAADNTPAMGDFQLFVNGSAVAVTGVAFGTEGNRTVELTTNVVFRSEDVIRASYTGSNLEATDGTDLLTFSQELIQNNVAIISPIPGRMEAEDYFKQQGIQLENSTDVGGGQNIGFLDSGDFLDYFVDVTQAGTYMVEYRNASDGGTGAVKLQLLDAAGNATDLHSASFASTGGWQTWTTTANEATLPAGQHTHRVLITQPLFNLNYLDFTFLTSNQEVENPIGFRFFPNPTNDIVQVTGTLPASQPATLLLRDATGRILQAKRCNTGTVLDESLLLTAYPAGAYYLTVRIDGVGNYTQKVVRQ